LFLKAGKAAGAFRDGDVSKNMTVSTTAKPTNRIGSRGEEKEEGGRIAANIFHRG